MKTVMKQIKPKKQHRKSEKCKFKQYENSVGHQHLLEMYEAGEDVDKPNEITPGKWGKV